MIPAGRLVESVAFFRRNTTGDAYGNPSTGWETAAICTRRCEFVPQRAQERLEVGRTEASLAGVIRLRKDSTVLTVTAADKAVINGVDYQLRSPPITDGQRDRFVEFEVERGVTV